MACVSFVAYVFHEYLFLCPLKAHSKTAYTALTTGFVNISTLLVMLWESHKWQSIRSLTGDMKSVELFVCLCDSKSRKYVGGIINIRELYLHNLRVLVHTTKFWQQEVQHAFDVQ